jgi:eukaryotic-like serine/threonine-protein kinase
VNVLEEAPRLQTLGKYELIVSLGQGGMANVYLAIVAGPAGFNKLLVLKLLREDVLAGMEEGLNMFLSEARLSARLVHPNIVHTYEVGEHDGRYFIAMEYLDGQSYGTVQKRSRKNSGIPIHEELRIISETARGLQYSHQLKGYGDELLGVVHRDVSPQNVFITYDGQVKLLDFGIAKTSDAEHLTQVGVIKGKLDYIAPEQLRGEPLDGRADIFALGAMLWEAVTGKRFAGGRNTADVTKVHARITGGELNVRVAQPEVPEELAQIIDRATALNAADRYPDAGLFADALDAYIESTGQKPSAKSLAAFVTPMFEDERQKMRRLVEREVDRIKTRPSIRVPGNTSSLPRVRLGEDSVSGMFVAGQGSEQGSNMIPRDLAPLLQSSRVAAQRKRTRVLVFGIAVAATVALLLMVTRSSDTSAAKAPTALSGEAATATSTTAGTAPVHDSTLAATRGRAPAPSLGSAPLVSLEIKVTPSNARVTLDGATVEAPFTGQFRKDPALHRLEVRSAGFRPVQQLVAFDQDRSLDIVLEKLERAPAPPPRRAHVSDKPAPAQAPEPAPPQAAQAPEAETVSPSDEPGGRLKTNRARVTRGGIDSNDPYSTGN